MRTLEITDLPEDVYREIEKLARVRGTSLASVAAEILARGIGSEDPEEARLLAEIRADRDAMSKRGVYATEQEIRDARDEGRK